MNYQISFYQNMDCTLDSSFLEGSNENLFLIRDTVSICKIDLLIIISICLMASNKCDQS